MTELGLVLRETPRGIAAKDSKRSFYQVADPFLGFWYRFVEPNRSLLEARRIAPRVLALYQGTGAGLVDGVTPVPPFDGAAVMSNS